MPAAQLKIDFVSDVVCPWCAVGLGALQQALRQLEGEVDAQLHFQPFELNPQMAAEGEDLIEHIAHKYGISPAQIAQNQEAIRQRGAAVGFKFNADGRRRVVNTFDAHRLLHWAGEQGKQAELKQALLTAYFTDGKDVSAHPVLLELVAQVGLDTAQARELLQSDRLAAEVRAQERFYQSLGISAVPSVIVNDRYLIQGGQPPEVFEQTLRRIAAEG
jgi:predicted DsbA family dithiol-disulfide isomerase